MKGKLIVIEGLDGSGKSTHVPLVHSYLENHGQRVLSIKLPHYEDESSALVRQYLSGQFGTRPQDVNAYAASCFYAVDRYAGYKTHWSDHYLSGGTVLADRYTTSNAYHQMTKLPREQWDDYLAWLFDFEYQKLGIPQPDRVIYLHMPIDVSQRLMSQRYSGDEEKKDLHERNILYLRACAEAALYAAKKLGWTVINLCENGQPKSIEENSIAICTSVGEIFEQDGSL